MGRHRLSHEAAIPLLAFLSGLPAAALGLVLLWRGEAPQNLKWTLTLVVGGAWWGFLFALRERLIRPLQTLANLLSAMREEDYSMRARLGDPEHSLGLLSHEVNVLGEMLREQRLEVLETTALLRRVMAEIDVAVFTFDEEDRLRLANRAAQRMLDRSEPSLVGRRAASMGLSELLEGPTPRVMDRAFPGGSSRWEVRRSSFRQEGRPHTLLVLSDLSRTLREEERRAWRRLVRVLSHEINNSLAPICSIADSLRGILRQTPAASDDKRENGWLEEVNTGLGVISGRSGALARFMSSYARLARLPRPARTTLQVGEWVERVAELETRLPIEIVNGPSLEVRADGDQLDQLLINLIDNAVEAARETGGGARVGWEVVRQQLEVWVEDDGPGIPDTGNLFVPFYTTKPNGSGIGLALCRQIAEAHGGTLTLENRNSSPGCIARLRLPIR